MTSLWILVGVVLWWGLWIRLDIGKRRWIKRAYRWLPERRRR